MSVEENVNQLQAEITKTNQGYESEITSLKAQKKTLEDQLEEAKQKEQKEQEMKKKKKGWVKKYLWPAPCGSSPAS